jgi:hypothetical protein
VDTLAQRLLDCLGRAVTPGYESSVQVGHPAGTAIVRLGCSQFHREHRARRLVHIAAGYMALLKSLPKIDSDDAGDKKVMQDRRRSIEIAVAFLR